MQISHHSTAASSSPVAGANGATSGSSPSSSVSSTSTATITANDFLQLLVTELQNQDPTANTDPNEYVDQLVQVNSLQQQIQMNQTLDGGPTLTGSSSGVLQELVQMNQTLNGDLSSQPASQSVASGIKTQAATDATQLISATNVPQHASAEAVATALADRPGRAAANPQNPNSQNQAFEQFAAHLKAEAQK